MSASRCTAGGFAGLCFFAGAAFQGFVLSLIGDVQNISRFQRWNWSDCRNGRARAALPQARVQQVPGGETTEPEESPR
jgi:hypothetical protein